MRQRWRTLYPGFGLRLTRWGAVYLCLTLLMAFAAVNSGNNGLMAVLGAVLASYVVGGVWSRQVLGNVSASVRAPAEIFAERPSLFEVELVNAGRFFPAYGLVVRSADGRVVLAEGLLAPGETVRRTVRWTFDHRGWRDFGSWRLEVVLPLGFFVKSKDVLPGREVLVYPAPERGPVARVETGRNDGQAEVFTGRGREGEVFQLRDFRDGDDTRQVHWKQSARQQRLIAVERRRPVDAPLIVAIDPVLSDPTDPSLRRAFEQRIRAATAAILRHLDRGLPVGLELGDVVIPPQRRRAHARLLLEPLATVVPTPPGELRR